MISVNTLGQGFQIGLIEPELTAVDGKVYALLQCFALFCNAGHCMPIGNDGENHICRSLLREGCTAFYNFCIWNGCTILIQTDVIEIPNASTRIAILSGINGIFRNTIQGRCFSGSAPLLHMEIGERNLDFLPACFRSHMLNALPVSTCSINELNSGIPIAAIG